MRVHPSAFVISSCVFVFNWVVSLVVAVVWAGMFSLAFPEMSTSVGGALCYVVVASLAFPAVALAVMRHELKPSARKLPTTTLDVVPHPGGVAVTQKVLAVRSGGTAILLISALGTGESKAYSSFATSLAKALRVYDSVTTSVSVAHKHCCSRWLLLSSCPQLRLQYRWRLSALGPPRGQAATLAWCTRCC